ncbi:putative membrane carboxypeptidase/penicillin-binding protein [Bradyrhizobium oligotrophicum S58]|uniref:Putative membrane carboxypeptidase/penicillin-binding protein n=1 Tax=Bradyrhizobium oligotrophicum S58 TaxID=1245469 RepID=M4Z7P0_9BRAD|nr:putative membrane carboxypeptidase/penicillin-binding protein [Bradyrhizobium oligotrophicum S58]
MLHSTAPDAYALAQCGKPFSAARIAAPVARDFMKLALADKPATPFKMPAGIKLVRVDSKTGMRAVPGQTSGVILEPFKPGTAPPDGYSALGDSDPNRAPSPPVSPADPGAVMGTGGLY